MESSPLARVPRRFQAMMNYLNAHQGSLISAFSVYSTALFLLLSLRLNTAIKKLHRWRHGVLRRVRPDQLPHPLDAALLYGQGRQHRGVPVGVRNVPRNRGGDAQSDGGGVACYVRAPAAAARAVGRLAR